MAYHPHLLFNDTSRLELDNPIRKVEIAIVMGDSDNGFPLRFQRWEDFLIKHRFEFRVLIGSPLIKQVDWPRFQPGLQQSQPFALPLRKRRRRETPIGKTDLMAELQPLE